MADMRAAAQVGLAVPSIKAALSDREFALITSVAGANVSEALRIPAPALWLEQHVLQRAGEADEAEAAGQVRYIAIVMARARLPPALGASMVPRGSCLRLRPP